MKRILILFAHPKFEQSRTNKALLQKIKGKEGITFHDLYEHYPDFHIDVSHEKKLLTEHDVIIWHHPFYWYSCPPLMKQWIDVVLEFGWAYGPDGDALLNKKCLNVITTGGSRAVYCSEGKNNYSINEFLRPFEQTSVLCGMKYLPPFAVMGTHQLSNQELDRYVVQYDKLIRLLQEGKAIKGVDMCELMNDASNLKNVNSI